MEIQNYTTVKYHYTHTSMGRIKKSENKKCCQGCTEIKPFQLFWCTRMMGTYENRLEVFQMIHIDITDSSNSIPRHIPNRNGNIGPHKSLYTMV